MILELQTQPTQLLFYQYYQQQVGVYSFLDNVNGNIETQKDTEFSDGSFSFDYGSVFSDIDGYYKRLDRSINIANERLKRLYGNGLSNDQTSCLNFLYCNKFEKNAISFYRDKISVAINTEKKRFVLTFYLDDRRQVYIGKYEGNRYELVIVDRKQINSVIMS